MSNVSRFFSRGMSHNLGHTGPRAGQRLPQYAMPVPKKSSPVATGFKWAGGVTGLALFAWRSVRNNMRYFGKENVSRVSHDNFEKTATTLYNTLLSPITDALTAPVRGCKWLHEKVQSRKANNPKKKTSGSGSPKEE